jgi:Spy/CpxP family protein refolding chaperone
MRLFAGVMFLAGLLAVTSLSTAQPPERGKQPPGKDGKGFQRPGGGAGFAGFGTPGQILSTGLVERLKLSDDQKKQLETLQKDVDEKLAKILTEDQNKQLKEMKDRGGRGGIRPGGGGGAGGRPGGRPGGDKKGGDPPPYEE